ncbi:Protein Mis18-beta [Nibea albiflora]|uniref:Protein Mis18-beta n=1 Tax=Nibea albiflora TaxID=240163 RepID=A0ACB7FF69_NIBAL|nr:Protein Mis18-beta [Nibea albiflora]
MEFDGSVLIRSTADLKMSTEVQHTQRVTLHCRQCSTVLGDSLGVCGEVKRLDSIICLKVTNDVVVSYATASREGEMANCIYSSLKCCCCRSAVGIVIHSAPSRLAAVRSMFLLYKPNISCYILDSSSMVTASALTFDTKTCKESMNEVRQQLEAQLQQMLRVKSRLDDSSITAEINK